MKKQLLASLMLCVVCTINAQKSAIASGGEGSGKSGTSSFTIGEVAYQSDIGNHSSSSQGTQHGYEIFEIAIKPDPQNEPSFTVYPNPTTDIVSISSLDEKSDYNFELYTSAGRLLTSGKLIGTASITMKDYTSGIYLIKVFSGQQNIKTFKIIKNR